MYRIALCDDEAAELSKTEQMIDSYKNARPEIELSVERFESVKELLMLAREKDYRPDLLMMDIYMPEKMGIEAAKELRELGSRGHIIFLTTSREHALEAFSVDAAQYLVKPVSEKELFPVLDRFLADAVEERKKCLLLRIEGRIWRVEVNSIVYCEAQGKNQCLNLADGTQHLLRMTMAELYEMLSQYPEFVRVGVSYIVNLDYVESLNAQDICLSTGKKIYPPRGACRTLKEQYFRYYCG